MFGAVACGLALRLLSGVYADASRLNLTITQKLHLDRISGRKWDEWWRPLKLKREEMEIDEDLEYSW